MYKFKSDFLKFIYDRGYIYQISDEEALDEISKLRKGTLGSWRKSPEFNLQINFIKRWELRIRSANRGSH